MTSFFIVGGKRERKRQRTKREGRRKRKGIVCYSVMLRQVNFDVINEVAFDFGDREREEGGAEGERTISILSSVEIGGVI